MFRASSENWIERKKEKKEATLVVVRSTGLRFGERERERREERERDQSVCVCAIQIRNWS